MRRLRLWIGGATVAGLIAAVGTTWGQTKPESDPKRPEIIQVKKQPEPTPQPEERPETAPTPTTETPSASTPAAPTAAPAAAPADAGPGASAVSSGNIAAAPSSDLGAILNTESTGVEIQRRNTVVTDVRIRGYHVGQIFTWGDGGYFFPAREDLDTAISKFEPGSIRDIVVIKGPYATRYGPGFAFLDIVTFDAPRATNGKDWELHGRTQFGYQTNGQRWEGLQSVEYGARDWGFRASYNILVGNDYRSGDGTNVPASYNSQNFNVAVGFDLSGDSACATSPQSSIDFKAVRLIQQDVEFPSLYFDLRRLDTEAYTVRYTSRNQPYFDLLTADFWYNSTVASGDTAQAYKQAFLSEFLPGPRGFVLQPTGTPPTLPPLFDRSDSRIAEHTAGYRLASTWGKKDCVNFTLGSDFTYLNQFLRETIRIEDPTGALPTFGPGDPTQNTGIPSSSSYDFGMFIEGNFPVNDRLSFRGGARGDYARTTTTSVNRLITGTFDLFGGTQFPGTEIDRTTVDPRVYSVAPWDPRDDRKFGLWSTFLSSEYKFDDCLTGIIGFGFAQRAPTLTELYATGPFIGVLQPGFSRLIGDPRLNPEQLKQFDVGLKGDYGWFKGSVNGFYAWIHDYITFDLNAGNQGGIAQAIYTNTDQATLAGGEAYGQVEATSWLTPFSSASYVQGRDLTHRDNRRSPNLTSNRRTGLDGLPSPETAPLPSISPLEIRSGLRIHESVDNGTAPMWSVEVSCRAVFDQNLVAPDLEFRTPGFTVWDLRTFWRATERLTLTAGVENIGDKNYREHIDPRANPSYFRQGTNFYFASQLKY